MRKLLCAACVVGIGLILAGNAARSAEPVPQGPQPWLPAPNCPSPVPLPTPPGTPSGTPTPQDPGQGQGQQGAAPDAAAPSTDAFAQPPAAGAGGESAMSNPQMIGDFSSRFANIVNGSLSGSSSGSQSGFSGSSSSSSHTPGRTIRIPVSGSGSFKIADNESPRPLDRVFVTYNYFDNINSSGVGGTNLHREVIGFEKTFLEGNASIGMRLPISQLQNGSGTASDVGDLSIILKYALLNDPNTRNVLSTGMVVTVPTGPDQVIVPGASPVHPVLLQPYLAGIYNMDKVFLQGFTSVVVPFDSRDAVLLFNDIGIGYCAYRCNNAILTSIIPTLEAHLTTPLSQRGSNNTPIGVTDTLSFTGGVHFLFWNRSRLTLGLNTPVTGPRPYGYEAVAQFNLLF